MSDCPFAVLRFHSSVLGRDVVIVKDRMRLVPCDAVVLSWAEAMAILAAGVPSGDLERVLAIRDQFAGTIAEPTRRRTPDTTPDTTPNTEYKQQELF